MYPRQPAPLKSIGDILLFSSAIAPKLYLYDWNIELRREGFYLVCAHFLRADARKKCAHTKYYFPSH
jgi:hypothetical protein